MGGGVGERLDEGRGCSLWIDDAAGLGGESLVAGLSNLYLRVQLGSLLGMSGTSGT